jgi:hypothetical protein
MIPASAVPDAGAATFTTNEPDAPVVVAACGDTVMLAPAPLTAAACANPGATVAAAQVITAPVAAIGMTFEAPVSETTASGPGYVPETSPDAGPPGPVAPVAPVAPVGPTGPPEGPVGPAGPVAPCPAANFISTRTRLYVVTPVGPLGD